MSRHQAPSLSLKRALKAPAEKVFAAWTQPEALKRWFAPRSAMVVPLAQTDVRVGGRFRIVMRAPDGEEFRVGGTYKEIVAGRKLVFTWAWESTPERQSLVTVDITPTPGGCELTLTHELFVDEAARDRHRQGWSSSLERLDHFSATAADAATGKEMQGHVVAKEAWLAARKALLAKEKEFTRLRDSLSAERRALPWVKVDRPYVFTGGNGKESLCDLFGRNSQLLVYHFMFAPDWQEGCPSCSFWADGYNGIAPHLHDRDVSLVVISRAPIEKLEAYKKRMGWTFKWVSSLGNDFNRDYHVSFAPEEKDTAYYNFERRGFSTTEAPGLSVFFRDAAGHIFHTYSCYARGLDMLNVAYHHLDLVPKGRDEAGLPYPMAWVRRHDSYPT
jgi:predicted dithiol-disulfide oxidoreductase (DUF899 family)/uncharacterized protein YndB with AHSA1/START domain